jgi:hypothetical protein
LDELYSCNRAVVHETQTLDQEVTCETYAAKLHHKSCPTDSFENVPVINKVAEEMLLVVFDVFPMKVLIRVNMWSLHVPHFFLSLSPNKPRGANSGEH